MIILHQTNGTLTMQKIDSNNGFTQIKLDDVEIITEYDIILHIINPKEIEVILTSMENFLSDTKMINDKPLLRNEIKRIKMKLHTIVPHRTKRGLINIIGTGLKWLSGTMDDNDRQDIENHLKTIDENNHMTITNLNKNIQINNHFNETFKKIKIAIESDRKEITNKFNEIESKYTVLSKQIIYLDTLMKIKILEDNVEHIQNNIVSSRLSIMSNNILTDDEIIKYNIDINKLKNIKLGTAKYKNDEIIFAIKIPNKSVLAKQSIFIPVSNNNSEELIFDQQQVIELNNTFYDFKNDLYKSNLKQTKLCIFNKNCNKRKNNKEETIHIENGLLLLKNQNNSYIESTCDERKIHIKNNYLILFNDCILSINNVTYKNTNKQFKQNFVLNDLDFNINNTKIKPTFDEIILTQVKNIEKIDELQYHKKISTTYNLFTLTAILAIIIILILSYIYFTRKRFAVNITLKNQENFQSKGGGVTSETPPTPIKVNWKR